MSTPGDRWGRDRCHTLSLSSTAFQTEGKLYLILDFLRGGDLFTRLSKEVQAPPRARGLLASVQDPGTGGGHEGRYVRVCVYTDCEHVLDVCVRVCRVCMHM